MTTIYITRHGETRFNIEKRFQGWIDSELTETGIANARALGERLLDIDIHRIYSSPLKRAKDTAEIIRGSRPIELIDEDGLKEMYFGKWEGLTYSSAEERSGIKVSTFFKNLPSYTAEDGEAFQDFSDRIANTFKKILSANEGKTILIVTHALPVKLLIALTSNMGAENIGQVPYVHQASLTEIHYEMGEYKPILIGDISHFKERNLTPWL
ncbi:histidine phosphatase family protein [Alloiococcus sp. CFN-8]|uniref:histidine phosphatase family protein n=1 Tax=Alloiococcus sp. CFN-8 TaxID=3416081 RepID=UPI003CF39721